ncbi:MAG: hypothetical protein OXB98_15750 [Bryobacterales bacterium]|nr:hypothetical protein [Bryobacterales bacterium]
MRDTTSKGSASRATALTRSGGGVRAVRLASCAVLPAEVAGAHWFSPYGLAADTAGGLCIVDRDSRPTRKADSSRVITSISGTGEQRFGVGCGPSHAARCGADQ